MYVQEMTLLTEKSEPNVCFEIMQLSLFSVEVRLSLFDTCALIVSS